MFGEVGVSLIVARAIFGFVVMFWQAECLVKLGCHALWPGQ